MKSTFEKMGGTYTLGADGIYYPNLVSTDEEPHYGKSLIILILSSLWKDAFST